MLKGMQFRIYTNIKQKRIIQKIFGGCTRVVYNCSLALRIRINEYKNGNSIGYKETNAMLTAIKQNDEYVRLKQADSIALQQSLRNLDKAYKKYSSKRASIPKNVVNNIFVANKTCSCCGKQIPITKD